MQNIITNQTPETVIPTPVQNLQTLEDTETYKPADMEVDSTAIPTEQ